MTNRRRGVRWTGALAILVMAGAARFRASGRTREFLDAVGHVVAVLSTGGILKNPPKYLDPDEPPVITDARRAALDAHTAPNLPRLEPASDERLMGRWVPEQSPLLERAGPYVEFDARRYWSASNGACNSSNGRFSTSDGRFLTVFLGGSMALCDPGRVPLERFVTDAVWAGFDGSRLVLVGRDGQELVRLKPV